MNYLALDELCLILSSLRGYFVNTCQEQSDVEDHLDPSIPHV